ncbi:MAG TPA: SRPBCC family protein [Patescibacteria group bacterium]|nr:SRPBCC family protein [Patescibacteria group bacterium]
MDNIAKASIDINASPARVWEAITTPSMIKEYLFGTNVESEWKVGSQILYRGEWQGKTYEDKGTILKLEPERIFESTYWSSMGGLEDKPENYKKVTYELTPIDNGGTKVTITQDNNPTLEDKNHSEQNWTMTLESLKKLLEK